MPTPRETILTALADRLRTVPHVPVLRGEVLPERVPPAGLMILRDGRHVITAPIADLPVDWMIEPIVGRRSLGLADVERGESTLGDELLSLRGVTGPWKPDDLSLTLHRGEVVGLAGLLGSGRSALARVIAGIEPAVSGEIHIKGSPVTIRKPADAIRNGIALVPEARATQGIIPDHSVASNLTLAILDRVSRGGLVRSSSVRDLARAGKGVLMISSELSELLVACDRIVVMADCRAHADLPRVALEDPGIPAEDTAHRLQAAEERLQIKIQKALTVGKETSRVAD